MSVKDSGEFYNECKLISGEMSSNNNIFIYFYFFMYSDEINK